MSSIILVFYMLELFADCFIVALRAQTRTDETGNGNLVHFSLLVFYLLGGSAFENFSQNRSVTERSGFNEFASDLFCL